MSSHFFPSPQVLVLKTADFNTDNDDKITIKNKSLCIVLFQNHSSISERLSKIWMKLSEEVAGVNFCACDLIEERTVAQSFISVAADESSPYYKFSRHSIPFILTYRNGKPQNLYSDTLDKSHLINYSTTMATGVSSHVTHDEEESEEDEDLPKKHHHNTNI